MSTSTLLSFRLNTPPCRRWLAPRREFSVKELSWCTKGKTATKLDKNSTVGNVSWTPVDRFGIVACMSKNRIIGVDGRLPWNIPEDRNMFKSLTKDKVLIVGRHTFLEEPDQCHISHAAACIVLSKTLTKDQVSTAGINTEILIAQSFPEALHLAREIEQMQSVATTTLTTTNEFADINCWIAGGEPVYNAAVMHPSAKLLHLTVVDTTIDDASTTSSRVARFPPKYHWDIRFKQISAKAMTTEDTDTPIICTHYELHRVKGRR